MTFYQALRFPFQEKDWFSRMLPLALLQLIPLVGQLILVGYGMELVRTLNAGQTGLPALKWRRALGDGLRLGLIGLVLLTPLLGTVSTIVAIGTSNGHLNMLGLGLSGVAIVLVLIIIIGLHLLGVRYAIENKGLLQPNSIAKLLAKNRAATARLILNAIALGLVTIVATGLGLALLIGPGLLALVACSTAWWYLLASFSLEIGLYKPHLVAERSTQYI